MHRREAAAPFERPVRSDQTLPQAFEASANRHGDRPAQQYKGGVYDRSLVAAGAVPAAPQGEFARLTYGEMHGLVRRLAAGFRSLGVDPDERVGVVAHTRMEWALSDVALLAAGAVVTGVSPTSSTARVGSLLGDAGATGVVVENAAVLERVTGVADDLGLSFAVVMDEVEGVPTDGDGVATDGGGGLSTDGGGMPPGADGGTAARELDTGDLPVYSLGEVYERGAAAYDAAAYESWLAARDPGDLASLVYTSGTTGRPRGVRLTHRNLGSNVVQCSRRFGPRPDRPGAEALDHTAVSLSVLPLSHVFERLVGHYLPFAVGACVSYAESPATLRADLAAVRPTMFTGVPRIYEKLFDGLRERAGEGARRRLFEWAVGVAREYDAADDPGPGLRARHALADRLVFTAVREALGGRLAFPICGGSSLSESLARCYRGMGVPVLEGYGLTETAPVVAVNPPGASRPGTVGPALAGVETRLDTDADESIRPVDGGEVGELLVRGPNVTDGYWNRPEATERAFVRAEDRGGKDGEDDGEGGSKDVGRVAGEDSSKDVDRDGGEARPWLRTGDVVERRPDGYLRFRGRSTAVLALSTGKKVAPAPIETALVERDPVEQALVLGDERPFVAALVVPAATEASGRGASEGVDRPADPGARSTDDRLRERVSRTVEEVNETLEPHERVERFRLVARPFTEENGLLTPTLKKRRHQIRERYAAEIAGLYDA